MRIDKFELVVLTKFWKVQPSLAVDVSDLSSIAHAHGFLITPYKPELPRSRATKKTIEESYHHLQGLF